MTLKYENTAQVGELIRAYDHQPIPGRTDRFVEGLILTKGRTKHGFDAFTILVMHDSTFTKPDYNRINEHVYVPFESDMDYDGRVTVIETVQ
jgi:hypothetical protein